MHKQSLKKIPDLPYNAEYFDSIEGGSLTSARAVMPIVLELSPARSIADFGCGRGAWLRAGLEIGVELVLGLDGPYMDREALLVDLENFRAVDLRRPVDLSRTFDLAVCVEVAEHLPARSARTLVGSLAEAAPVVLFSAAPPGQGGTWHVNEQWPAYWQRLFSERGMRKHDVVRPLIWADRSIATWYRQNIYLFAKEDITRFDHLARFEPEFYLLGDKVASLATFGWSSRALRFLPLVRGIHAILSRLGPGGDACRGDAGGDRR
jgi:SAM-dependent methyltransferase